MDEEKKVTDELTDDEMATVSGGAIITKSSVQSDFDRYHCPDCGELYRSIPKELTPMDNYLWYSIKCLYCGKEHVYKYDYYSKNPIIFVS